MTVKFPFALLPPRPVNVIVMDVEESESTVTPENAPLTVTEDTFSRFEPEILSVSLPLLRPLSYGKADVGKLMAGLGTVVVVVGATVVVVVGATVVVVVGATVVVVVGATVVVVVGATVVVVVGATVVVVVGATVVVVVGATVVVVVGATVVVVVGATVVVVVGATVVVEKSGLIAPLHAPPVLYATGVAWIGAATMTIPFSRVIA